MNRFVPALVLLATPFGFGHAPENASRDLTQAVPEHQPALRLQKEVEEAEVPKRVKVLVARMDLALWTQLGDPLAAFEKQELFQTQVPADYVPAMDHDDLLDLLVIRGLRKGQAVTWSDLQKYTYIEAVLNEGKRAFTLAATPATAAGGFVLPGTRVDVIGISKAPEGGFEVRYVLESVKVVALDLRTARPDDRAGVNCSGVTLEVNPTEALILAKQAAKGTLMLTLRPYKEGLKDAKEDRPVLPRRLPPLTAQEARKFVRVYTARRDLSESQPVNGDLFDHRKMLKEHVADDYIPADEDAPPEWLAMRRKQYKGEVLTRRHLYTRETVGIEAQLPAGKRLFAVSATPETAGGVLAGAHVDVILVAAFKDTVDTKYVLEDVLVRGVDQLSVRTVEPAMNFKTVSLETTPEEALKLAKAGAMGTLRLSVRRPDDKKKFSEDVPVPPPPPPRPDR